MATGQLRRVIQTLRSAARPHEEAGLSDGQLLASYVRTREEAAFAGLVQRHGPMVWGVCRRVLASHQDAEDAFQATFLVLVRKAACVVPPDMVANWLYGVAHQTARKARATTARRRGKEKQVTAMPERALEAPERWDDLRPLLDQELSRLPDKYRAVIVLCDLEGKTRKETARHFNVPEGTVASRLATARTMLAKRLARHGVPLSAAALAAALSQNGASATVPTSVALSAIQAATLFAAGQTAATGFISVKAVALADGVLKTMLLTKLKIATAVLIAVAALGTSVAAIGRPALSENRSDVQSRGRERPEKELASRERERPDAPANQSAPVKKDAEAPPKVVGGIVKAVDVAKNSLTVAHRDGDFTFTLAQDAHVSIDRKPGEIAMLPVGASVVLSQFTDQSTVRDICASGASVFGSVKAVDAAKNTIAVANGDPADRTFSVTSDTIIVIDGKPGQLAGIPPGASLHVLNLCVDQTTVNSINAEGPSFCNVPVKAVDAAKLTITFDDKAPAELAGKTIPVAPNVDLRIDGQAGALAGLPAGAFVNVVLTVDKTTALRMDAQGPAVGECGGSLVKAVDVEKNTITFDDAAPGVLAGKTFAVAKDALIVIDDKPGTLSGLPPGAFANMTLSIDQTTARHIHVQGPRVTGIVTAVDAGKSLIAVDARSYPVAKDAPVAIDGKRASLADLPPGASVILSLYVDRTTVGMIQTKAP